VYVGSKWEGDDPTSTYLYGGYIKAIDVMNDQDYEGFGQRSIGLWYTLLLF
jgi:hypothetical protein